MSKEGGMLNISDETIDKVLDDPGWETDLFVESTMSDMEKEQPALYSFVSSALEHSRSGNPDLARMSASMSYKMLPEKIRQGELNQTHIDVVRRSLQESNPIGSRDGLVTINISWALNKFIEDSPSYTEWLNDCLATLDTVEEKIDFMWGGFITVLPFLMREEGHKMEDNFQ